MASRRDELNAYTFAKKRLVSAFLQPSPSGTEEGAPRPLRAVLPGVVVGVLVLAGFGAWGMFKPKAPKGWDNPGEKVIIASDSTTRYVVLETDGKKQLHPVLNLASAKLLLDPSKLKIVKVDEKVLDSGKIPHGATIGIPYAPDRLPDDDEAVKAKRWAVCTRPGADGAQKAVFVLADRDRDKVEGKNRLGGGDVMYVRLGEKLHIVDGTGTAYEIEADDTLLRTVVGSTEPQDVTEDWLKTLKTGSRIQFPGGIEGIGTPAGAPGNLDAEANRIGMVLRAPSGTGLQHYVVLKGTVRPVTDFMAKLLLNSPEATTLGQQGKAREVSAGAIRPENALYGSELKWPEAEARPVNTADSGRDTLCSVLRDVDEEKGTTTLSTWAADDYPATLPNRATNSYVTPGSGLLFRQIKGRETGSGGVFLVTDTGLRYAVQANTDSGQDDAGIGTDGKKDPQEEAQEGNRAQIRLGYRDARPVPVPATWSGFLPTGPRLSESAARQPQGS
ncbi:type VII secretion protein EccB [Streptomyces sp. TRM 70361]|uniref:type VII secretion protein EccB n=1 Tax=Streptomyces sp. TRM 70361 TaxID=3116553 RepID=UPI002E7BE95C|nr:type VII secretion protein EccB [Streptomyces sp. TRM 70361]MEE1941780.1 type VII secretion protein EccB [Streptomyces sp. TRM 70361]